jgi:hypothetical protein
MGTRVLYWILTGPSFAVYYIFMFSSIAGIDGMIAWNLGAFLSFLLVLATWAAEFNIRASALLPIRHTVRTALL